jgi:hypothetical protein
MPLNFFWLSLVNVCEFVASTRMSVQQLIELGLNRLRVAVFGALDGSVMNHVAMVATACH